MKHLYVKICGLTNLADARVAVAAGADLIGFILAPKSPRYVTPETIAAIITALRSDQEAGVTAMPKTVGVFVNESPERISEILARSGLDLAQLHGDEPPEMLTRLARRGYKALRPQGNAEAIAMAQRYALADRRADQRHDRPGLMIDAYDPDAYGGTGKLADWQTAAQLAAAHCGLLLAGGLTPDNVAVAVCAVQPWGVDVASGVELAPGQKDHAAVTAFVAEARRATSNLGDGDRPTP